MRCVPVKKLHLKQIRATMREPEAGIHCPGWSWGLNGRNEEAEGRGSKKATKTQVNGTRISGSLQGGLLVKSVGSHLKTTEFQV
jgi:hypothetical protein